MESKRLMMDGEETPYLLYEDGTIYSEKRKRFLKGTTTEEGYVRICTLHKGKNVYFLLHRKLPSIFFLTQIIYLWFITKIIFAMIIG